MSPRTGAVIVAMTGALGSGGAEAQCRAAPDAPRLDHVVIAVRDLDAATAPFAAGGFRLKPGRLHANNLLNRHIKFSNGTSLEFMSVRGAPRDRMARDYADLIQAGEGGVLVALAIASAARVAEAARAWGEALQRSTSGPWSFVSFPHTSPAAAVFF